MAVEIGGAAVDGVGNILPMAGVRIAAVPGNLCHRQAAGRDRRCRLPPHRRGGGRSIAESVLRSLPDGGIALVLAASATRRPVRCLNPSAADVAGAVAAALRADKLIF